MRKDKEIINGEEKEEADTIVCEIFPPIIEWMIRNQTGEFASWGERKTEGKVDYRYTVTIELEPVREETTDREYH